MLVDVIRKLRKDGDKKGSRKVSEEQSTEGTVSEREDKGNTEGAPPLLKEGRDTHEEDSDQAAGRNNSPDDLEAPDQGG